MVAFSFLAISTNSQNYFTESISENLLTYNLKNYPEKIFIHSDKTFYSNEDTVWFSAYLVNGVTHQKSQKSALIYAELINEKDSVIDRKKLFINNLNTAGDFKLSKNIKSGNYKIRAYTNYMRNKDPDFFFQKEIKIWSSNKLENNKESTQKNNTYNNIEIKPDISFYPQGGYLVDGLLNKVAIKLKDAIFNEVKINGIIRDENNNEITSFKSVEFGLGEFFITPEKGKTYFAVIKKNEKTYTYKLPISLEKGFVVNATNNQKELFIDLKSTTINGLLGTSLVIHQRGKLIYNNSFSNVVNSKTLKIPIKMLNSGVLHITLFNSNTQPVCERLIFIENDNKKTAISIEKPKEYFGNRKKITLKINVEDALKNNIPSKLSMTVKDLNISPENTKEENIKTWLLLNSDLRGKIKNPNYFFENENIRKRRYLLDLVMLTHGWRRFTWQEINTNQQNKQKFEAEKGIIISGKTLNMEAPYGIKSVPTRLTFIGKVYEQEPIQKSNNNGEYSYGPFLFFDSIPVLVEARINNFQSNEIKDRKILIIPNTFEEVAKLPLKSNNEGEKRPKNDVDSYLKFQKYLEDIKNQFKQSDYILDEVVVNSKLKNLEDIREENMNARASYGFATNRFDVTKHNYGSNSALQLFNSILGVRVINDSLIITRQPNERPLLMLDENPIDVSDLSLISASEISFIDVLTGGDALMLSSNGAVISMYSKQGGGFNSKRKVKRKPGIIDYIASGFYTAKEFYAPDHINGFEEQTKADIRTTLHWAPNIVIDGKKAVEISFFTSDADSKYVIEVQGITTSGIPLYQTTEITVD